MRLLLDAHLSGRVVGRWLREAGHDVRALDEHRHLEGIDDEAVLELGALERRILLTHNVKDFPEILRDWAEEGRHHAGCVMLVGIRQHEFGELIRAIASALDLRPDQETGIDRAVFISRTGR